MTCPTCGKPLANGDGIFIHDWMTGEAYHVGCAIRDRDFAPGEVSPIGDGAATKPETEE